MGNKLEKKKMILDNLYRCRDIEINNLWQKSTFLGTLLALCFTGYGVLLFSMITAKKEVLFNYNLLCFAICFISIIFSILWIYMFKGSKAHYELYERAISKFEKNKFEKNKFKKNKFKKNKFKKNQEFVMGNLSVEAPIDNNLFSTKGGGFSPSKINIMIGQISLILWIFAIMCHLFEIMGCSLSKCIIQNEKCNSIILVILAIILFLYIFFVINKNAKSSYL